MNRVNYTLQTLFNESQNFVDPRFSKTLALVKSMVQKYRPRLFQINQLTQYNINYTNPWLNFTKTFQKNSFILKLVVYLRHIKSHIAKKLRARQYLQDFLLTSLKGMNFDHDFSYSFPFSLSSLKKRGKKKRRLNYQKS